MESLAMRPGATFFLSILLVVSACQFEHDAVEAGYYGSTQAGAGGKAATTSASAAPTSHGGPSNGSGSGPTSQTQPGSAGRGSAPMMGQTAGVGMISSPTSTGGSGATTSAGQAVSPPMAAAGGGATAAPGACDMTGRWVSTTHLATDALGQIQFAHSFIYYEISQQGDKFTVTKGILCGDDAIGVGSFAVTVDFKPAWPSERMKVGYTGRTGTSMIAAGGCMVTFDKWYTVRGATNPYYLDPSTTLPTADDKATDTMPGWEDWDNDGNPGITGVLSGIVTGKIFVAPRQWTQPSGTVPDISKSFVLPTTWDQQQNVMAYDGSDLLGSEADRAADMTLHFTEFARLSDGQATGDDTAICNSVVDLVPTLTPKGSASEM